MMHRNIIFLALITIFLGACTRPGESQQNDPNDEASGAAELEQDKSLTDVSLGKPTIAEAAENTAALQGFAQMYEGSDLDSLLSEDKQYTIFAPSDAALKDFAKQGTLPDSGKVDQMLQHVIVEGTYKAADLTSEKSLTAIDGSTLQILDKDGKLEVAGAAIIYPDFETKNATIHIVDEVLQTE